MVSMATATASSNSVTYGKSGVEWRAQREGRDWGRGGGGGGGRGGGVRQGQLEVIQVRSYLSHHSMALLPSHAMEHSHCLQSQTP